MIPVFALVDCNNFYASCERLFRPDLRGRPIVVLSNNDGCVVARSAEAKALGIKMGTPLFKIGPTLTKHRVEIFSSNYTLYGDISGRVMSTLATMAPRMEVYSIDEAFLDLTGLAPNFDLLDHGRQIKQRTEDWTGIPVCVGIGPTKTLAKLANYAAKRYPATGGVVDLTGVERQRRLMSITPVGEVWGIGHRLSARMQSSGIATALDLAQASPATIRRHYSVVVERTVRELNGTSCLELEDAPAAQQQIVCSRAFSARVTELGQLREAVREYSAKAAAKLRRGGQVAQTLTVSIQTSPFSGDPTYANSANIRLVQPTDDTRTITRSMLQQLDRLWRDGYRYSRAGVMLSELSARTVHQVDLFSAPAARPGREDQLMELVDGINKKFGRGRVRFGGHSLRYRVFGHSILTPLSRRPRSAGNKPVPVHQYFMHLIVNLSGHLGQIIIHCYLPIHLISAYFPIDQ